jgi:hypothetical protein
MSVEPSSTLNRKRPSTETPSSTAKERRLFVETDEGLQVAVNQSGADMEQIALNTVMSDRAATETEKTIHLGSWFSRYPGLDVTCEAMWTAHSTMLVLLSSHDLRKFVMAEDWNTPDVYPAHNACCYTLKTFQADRENGSFPADVSRDGDKYNSDTMKKKFDRSLHDWNCGEKGWIGIPATALTMILPLKRLVRGTTNRAKAFPIPLSKSLEGALERSPFLCVVPDMPSIQVAVGCRFFRSYDHEGGGTTVREHWCQITEVVARSWKGAKQASSPSPPREAAMNAAPRWNREKPMAQMCQRTDLDFEFHHSEDNLPEGFLNPLIPTSAFSTFGGTNTLPTGHVYPPDTMDAAITLQRDPQPYRSTEPRFDSCKPLVQDSTCNRASTPQRPSPQRRLSHTIDNNVNMRSQSAGPAKTHPHWGTAPWTTCPSL